MRWLSRLRGGLRALFRPRRAEQELDDELRAFFDAAVDDKLRLGMTRPAAARAARVQFGHADAVRDRVRDVGWETVVEGTWHDVRYAVRMLRKSPGFTAVSVLTLVLGIGATTAIFSLLDAVILKSLPVSNPEQLVLVRAGGLYPVFKAFQTHTEIFSDLLATSGVTSLDVETGAGLREPTGVSLVSGSYFSTLGVAASIGRTFTEADDRTPGAHPVAVVSYGFWQRRFGQNPLIPGRVVRISGAPFTILGVAPPGFFGEQVGDSPDVWVPLTMWGQIVPGRNVLQNPGTGWLRMIGRVRPGVSVSGVQPALTHTFKQVVTGIFGPKMADDTRRDIANATVTFEPAGKGLSRLRAQFSRPLELLMGAVILVLLMACANIASLLLARATARRREIDVRLALGMSRARLVRQLLTESVVLAAMGGVCGIAFASFGREALLRLISADGSRLPVAVATDARLLVFVASVSLATAVLFGLAPAWQSARRTIVSSLVAKHQAGGPRQPFRSVLVVVQVAVSLVLLMGAGLFLRTIANLRDVDLGFAPDRLIVVDVKSQAPGYQGDQAMALNRRLLDSIGRVPGVASVSMSENGVLLGRDSSTNLMRPEGFVGGPEGFPRTFWDIVGPRYFTTIGSSLLSGRDFTERDDESSPYVVAINEGMARRFFGRENAVGRRLAWGVAPEQTTFEIVAIIRDVKHGGARDEPQLRFYLPFLQIRAVRPGWIPASTRFFVRTSASPAALAPLLRQLVPSEDSRLAVATLDLGPSLVSRTLVRERMVAILLVAFGVLAAGLACLGLYGLIAYHVVQRTSEIGVRMALGAQPRQVTWAMLKRALLWIAAGVALGIPLALSGSGLAQNLLYGLSATDPATLLAAMVVMSAMGVLAAYIPARRASRVDPLTALRTE